MFFWRKFQIAILTAIFLFSLQTAVLAQKAKQRLIPYPSDYVLDQAGASSYKGLGNVPKSRYFNSLDFFKLRSNKQGLTILSNYKTYQQTTETTCGPAAALTVLQPFGNTNYHELQLSGLMNCLNEHN